MIWVTLSRVQKSVKLKSLLILPFFLKRANLLRKLSVRRIMANVVQAYFCLPEWEAPKGEKKLITKIIHQSVQEAERERGRKREGEREREKKTLTFEIPFLDFSVDLSLQKYLDLQPKSCLPNLISSLTSQRAS